MWIKDIRDYILYGKRLIFWYDKKSPTTFQ